MAQDFVIDKTKLYVPIPRPARALEEKGVWCVRGSRLFLLFVLSMASKASSFTAILRRQNPPGSSAGCSSMRSAKSRAFATPTRCRSCPLNATEIEVSSMDASDFRPRPTANSGVSSPTIDTRCDNLDGVPQLLYACAVHVEHLALHPPSLKDFVVDRSDPLCAGCCPQGPWPRVIHRAGADRRLPRGDRGGQSEAQRLCRGDGRPGAGDGQGQRRRSWRPGRAGRSKAFRSGIKDLFGTKGVHTQAASHILDGFKPEYEFDRHQPTSGATAR